MNALSNTDFKKISNNARPKRLGYYASWLWMMFVFLFLFVSAFVFLSGLYWTIRDGSIQEHWFSTGRYLCDRFSADLDVEKGLQEPQALPGNCFNEKLWFL